MAAQMAASTTVGEDAALKIVPGATKTFVMMIGNSPTDLLATLQREATELFARKVDLSFYVGEVLHVRSGKYPTAVPERVARVEVTYNPIRLEAAVATAEVVKLASRLKAKYKQSIVPVYVADQMVHPVMT